MPQTGPDLACSNRLGDLAEILELLERAGTSCLVFGGWAEELLELRTPGPRRDMDFVHLNDSFAAIDRAFCTRQLPDEIRAKRFPHERAFSWRGLCCELLLIQDWRVRPVSWFRGDVPFLGRATARAPWRKHPPSRARSCVMGDRPKACRADPARCGAATSRAACRCASGLPAAPRNRPARRRRSRTAAGR
jgi:hypothetical protein